MLTKAEEIAIVESATAGHSPSEGGWINVPCPLCVYYKGTERYRKTFGLAPNGYYHCFRCEASGRLYRDEEEVAVKIDVESPDIELPVEYLPLWQAKDSKFAKAEEYLAYRNIDKWVWAQARLGVCLEGKYKDRIIIPFLRAGQSFTSSDESTALKYVGFSARTFANAGMKNLYPKNMKRATTLFNLEALEEPIEEPVIIVEGAFDALSLWPNAVALLGKPVNGHIELIAQTRRPICVCLDGDAWVAGKMLATRLKLKGARAAWAKLPAKEDPNSIDKKKLKYLISQSLQGV